MSTPASYARHYALVDLAVFAERQADAASEAVARCPAGDEQDYLKARANELRKAASRLRSAA